MPKVRYPLATAFMSRNGTLGVTDAFVKNAFIDKYEDKSYVVKRPGSATYQTLSVGGQDPQGAFYFNGFVYEVNGDILYRTSGTSNAGSNLSVFTATPTPNWSKRTDAQAMVFNDRMWLFGPGVQPGGTAVGEVWSTQDGITWALATSGVGAARLDHRCCVFNGQMWAMGGRTLDGTAVLNDVLSSSDGTTWTQVTIAPWAGRQSFGLIAANNGMYVFGGGDVSFTNFNDCWYTPDGVNWVEISTNCGWTARAGFGFVFHNYHLVITGGVSGATFFNDTWTSLDGANWIQTSTASFDAGRFGNTMVSYAGNMYSIGGVESGAIQTAEIYSSSDFINWTLVTPAPGFSARVNPAAAVFKTPSTVSSFRYETVWVMGGGLLGAELRDVWYGNINTPINNSFTLAPSIAGQMYQFTTFLNGTQLVLKNQSNLWVLTSGSLTKVTDPNYPPSTVPGLVSLNSYLYVTSTDGNVRASKFDNALQWPALQFTPADYEDDPVVIEKKYLNYITVFGQYTTQFFYDAANPAPGISISPYTGANLRIGCAFPNSLQELQNTLMWVGQTVNRNWSVYILNSMSPQKISVSWVDKIINENMNSGTTCYVTGSEGHTFYVLNFTNLGASLVYDYEMKMWYVWTGPIGALNYSYALTTFNFGGDLLIGNGFAAGMIFNTSPTLYTDAGAPFPMMVQTDKLDAGTLMRKFQSSVDIVCDTSQSTVLLSWSDDDYQTWTQPVYIPLSGIRPRRNRLGSFRRRAYRLLQTDIYAARWEALELTFSENDGKNG